MMFLVGLPRAERSPPRLLLACIVTLMMPFVAIRAAQQVIDFDIPAGSLDVALTAYASASGTQLIFEPAITDGHRTRGLHGTFSAESGLRHLLSETGLAPRAVGDQGFTLVPDADAGSRATIGV